MHPLGLVAKGTVWYLVANTDAGMRTFRVERITAVEPSGEASYAPRDSIFAAAWKLTRTSSATKSANYAHGSRRPRVVATTADGVRYRVRIGPTGADGRVEIEMGGRDDRSLAGLLAGFGAAVEISDPPELRALLATLGAELTATYATKSTGENDL